MEGVTQGVQGLSVDEPRRQRKRNAHAYHSFGNGAAPEAGSGIEAANRAPPPLSGPGQGASFVPGTAQGTAHGAAHGAAGQHAPVHQMSSMQNIRPEPTQFQAGGGGGAQESPNTGFPSLAIPSLPQDRMVAQHSLGHDPLFKTFENACPPPATTKYEVLDQGISGPQFTRLTMYNVPATEQLRASTQLPLALVVKPFSYSTEVPVVDFSDLEEPPRCRRCRAYMNPSMLFVQGGTKFVCNMCQFTNSVDADYFQPIDASNRRIDWQDRPELLFGSYDLIVPKQYWKDDIEPSPLHHLFLIDVTSESVKKGLPKLAVEAIRSLLYSDEYSFPVGGKIAIATFDRTVHFYNLNPSLTQAQMMVMPDVHSPFLPLENGLFVDPEESRAVIESLLDSLDVMFQDTPFAEPAFGAALDVALLALEKTGGRVSATLSSLPAWGPGHLKLREFGSSLGASSTQQNAPVSADPDKELLKASNPFYTTLGAKYAKAGVGLDLFTFPNSYIDLANTGEVSRASGGNVYFYPRFVPERDGRRFMSDFCAAGSGEIGTQALVKVRSSNGLQVQAYYGNLYSENDALASDPFLGQITSKTNFAALFSYDGKLDTRLDAHFQVAILYTSSNGQRRVRVHNMLASVTEQQYKPVVNFIDVDAVMGVAARIPLWKMGQLPLKEIRFGLNEKVVDIFAAYRKMVGSSQPSSQLLMPTSLRSLIVYFLALQKIRAIRGSRVFSDGRMSSKFVMNTLSIDELSLYLYPRIVGLHNLRDDDCQYNGSQFNMPVNVEASVSKLDEGGAYFAFNGQSLLLWINRRVNPLFLQDLFGPSVNELQDLDPYLNELPIVDTKLNQQARALVDYFAKIAGVKFLGIQLARQNLDGAEVDFMSMMIEDRNMDTYNYKEFVSHVHRHVKISLENNSTKSSLLGDSLNLAHGF